MQEYNSMENMSKVVHGKIRFFSILIGAFLLFSIIFGTSNWYNSRLTSIRIKIANDAMLQLQRINMAAPQAVEGIKERFKQLINSRKQFNMDLTLLSEGGNYEGHSISGASASAKPIVDEVKRLAVEPNQAVEAILNIQEELISVGKMLQNMEELSPNLLELSEQIVGLKIKQAASPSEISAASQLVMLTQRIALSASKFHRVEEINPENTFLLVTDTKSFSRIVDGFLNGDEATHLKAAQDGDTRNKLLELQKAFADYKDSVKSININFPKLISAQATKETLSQKSETFETSLAKLQDIYDAQQDSQHRLFWEVTASEVCGLLSAIYLILLLANRKVQRGNNEKTIE